MGRTNKILKGPEKLMVQSNSFHITKLNKKLVDKMVSKYQDDECEKISTAHSDTKTKFD